MFELVLMLFDVLTPTLDGCPWPHRLNSAGVAPDVDGYPTPPR